MWNIYKHTMQGTKHERKKVPCEDYIKSKSNDKYSILALADGAGSCKNALIASTEVCTLIIKYFDKAYKKITLDTDLSLLKEEIISFIQKNIVKNKKGIKKLSELSTTLLFVVIVNDIKLIGQIGDGLILYTKDNSLNLVYNQEDTDFVNETMFVNSAKEEVINSFNLSIINDSNIDTFILTSDGLEDLFVNNNNIIDSSKKHLDVIMDKIKINRELRIQILMNNVKSTNPQFNDDMSLGIITNENYIK